MSVKTYLLLFRTLAIDTLSHVSQEREPTISQFLQNAAVRPKLWHTTVKPHLDWVRFRPSETSFNMAAAAETKWRWDLHMVNCDRQKRFSQNERRRADLQISFLIFALGLSYDLSNFSDIFTPFFRLWKTIITDISSEHSLRTCTQVRRNVRKSELVYAWQKKKKTAIANGQIEQVRTGEHALRTLSCPTPLTSPQLRSELTCFFFCLRNWKPRASEEPLKRSTWAFPKACGSW